MGRQLSDINTIKSHNPSLLQLFPHEHVGSSSRFKDIGTNFHALLQGCKTGIKPQNVLVC